MRKFTETLVMILEMKILKTENLEEINNRALSFQQFHGTLL